jgi:hypothetical protein
MNHKTLQNIFLPFVHRNDVPTILWGPTGVGKTTAIYEYGQRVGAKVVVLHLASQEPGDLVGLPTREGMNLTTDQQHALLNKLIESGRSSDVEDVVHKMSRTKMTWSRPEWLPTEDDPGKYIFFLDEFNRAPKYVLACMFPFILEGRLHTHRVPKDSWIVAAANPGGGEEYEVTEIRDRALISRLCHIELKPTKEEWMIRHDGVVHEVVHKVISKNPELLGFDTEPLGFEIRPDARAVTRLGITLKTITKEEWASFGYEYCQGCIGKEGAAMIEKEWKNKLESISPDDVLNNYKKIRGDVKSYSSVENIRNDVIGGCITKLLVTIKKLGELSEDQTANVRSFLKDIPRDTAVSFLSQAAAGDEYRDDDVFRKMMIVLGKDRELYVYILEANSRAEAEREKAKDKEAKPKKSK